MLTSEQDLIPAALPALPRPGGPARAVLMLVEPRRLFLYWVMDAAVEAIVAKGPGPAELRLETSADGRRFAEVARREFDFRAPSWFITNDQLDCFVRVRLGFGEGSGFHEVLVSNPLRVPRVESGRGGEAWAELRRPGAHALPVTGRGSSPAGHVLWSAGAAGDAGRRRRDEAPACRGDLAIVLHAHLPFVRHPEREYFLEEHWLFEAITETYLPLLDMFEHLLEDEVPVEVTMSLTPTLMAMLRDPVLIGKYERHLARMCELAAQEVSRTRRDVDFSPVTGFYRDRLERLRHLFLQTYRRDLVAQFARFERAGLIEIIGCAATHGFLPHLAIDPETVSAQIAVGVAEHRRQIGHAPRGLWLPECAYFEGLDRILARHEIEYCFLDAHALRNASSRPRHDLHAPLRSPAGVAMFGRDEESSVQVWSAEQGYPGDPSYRDFYRDIGFDLEHDYVAPYLDPSGRRGMTGFKYHAITGRGIDRKEPYRRDQALRTAARHAEDFVLNRRAQLDWLAGRIDRRPLAVAMYDAELFGHWWFEGPEWLEGVLRRLPARGVRALSPPRYLAENPVGQIAEPSASSWGARGYYDVWLNETNDWILPPLHDAGRRMVALAGRAAAPGTTERRALAQLGRELLLAQSSDWPFILKNVTSVDYARRRVHDHLDRFFRLARQIEAGSVDEAELGRLEALDNLFPDLDPGVWRRG